MIDVSPSSGALQRCVAALRAAPAALFTDVDGTVSEIAATPEAAHVSDLARGALARLAERLSLVAVVTGRAAADGAAMVGLPNVLYIGNHGLESLYQDQVWRHEAGLAASRSVATALADVERWARAAGVADGLVFENKLLSGSLHYRLAADPARVGPLLVDAARMIAYDRDLLVTEGRMVVEFRPKVAVNKGAAIADTVRERALRGVVFLGDDITDVDGFRALTMIREIGSVNAVNVAVVGDETPALVRETSDVTVRGVSAAARLLSEIADALEESDGSTEN